VCILEDSPWFELRKVYRVLPDDDADKIDWIRVVDEFGQDYLYPRKNFVPVDLPQPARRFIPDVTSSSKRNPKKGRGEVLSPKRASRPRTTGR
jgi:hypothetical protein